MALDPQLPVNMDIAIGRMKLLARCFQGNLDLCKQYDEILQDQVKKGIIEKVSENMQESDRKHYLLHHPVITPAKVLLRSKLCMMHLLRQERETDVSMSVCIEDQFCYQTFVVSCFVLESNQ